MNIKKLLSKLDGKTINDIVNWLIVIRDSDCIDCYEDSNTNSPRKLIDEQLNLMQFDCVIKSDCKFSIAKKLNLTRFFGLIGVEDAIEFYEWLETIAENDKKNAFNALTPQNIILHHFNTKNVEKPKRTKHGY